MPKAALHKNHDFVLLLVNGPFTKLHEFHEVTRINPSSGPSHLFASNLGGLFRQLLPITDF
jgi:hypothetical protein